MALIIPSLSAPIASKESENSLFMVASAPPAVPKPIKKKNGKFFRDVSGLELLDPSDSDSGFVQSPGAGAPSINGILEGLRGDDRAAPAVSGWHLISHQNTFRE
ncbi:hypothetical protein PHLCEN_2v2493 [Hermanssonia centrifuga]|uniref:Uncharacterized protein n=1 Tax=Hermanssonia centrifuga TaxID=98765 RepID=A0A2R6RLS1_9APHY|nr:hypothetical protein PHLCEN_2v2493 [Hermanssonia centrifuga]